MILLKIVLPITFLCIQANAGMSCFDVLNYEIVENIVLNQALKDLQKEDAIKLLLKQETSLASPITVDPKKVQCGGSCAINLMQGIRKGLGLPLINPGVASRVISNNFSISFQDDDFHIALQKLANLEKDLYGVSSFEGGNVHTSVLNGIAVKRDDLNIEKVDTIRLNTIINTNPQILSFVAVNGEGFLNGHAIIPIEIENGNTLVVMDPNFPMIPVRFLMESKDFAITRPDGILSLKTIRLIPKDDLAKKLFLSFFHEGAGLDSGELWIISILEFQEN